MVDTADSSVRAQSLLLSPSLPLSFTIDVRALAPTLCRTGQEEKTRRRHASSAQCSYLPSPSHLSLSRNWNLPWARCRGGGTRWRRARRWTTSAVWYNSINVCVRQGLGIVVRASSRSLCPPSLLPHTTQAKDSHLGHAAHGLDAGLQVHGCSCLAGGFRLVFVCLWLWLGEDG